MSDSEADEMAASVRIEDEAFVDTRIELLGTLAGYNRFEALGRMAHLWRVCTQRDTYVLEEVWISACLGERGPEAIVQSGLGVRVAGGIRVKGTEGRIEWLRNLRNAAAAGGRAKQEKAAQKASPEPASGVPSGRIGSPEPASGVPSGSLEPAESKQKVCPLIPTLIPSLKEKTPLPPAKPGDGEGEDPATTPAVGPNPDAVAAHWNAFPGLTPIVSSSPHRDRIVRQWATGNPLWVEHWRAAIAFMGSSPFYCGQGEKCWRADLGWLLKNDNFATVVDRMHAARTDTTSLHHDQKRTGTGDTLNGHRVGAESGKYERPASDGLQTRRKQVPPETGATESRSDPRRDQDGPTAGAA